MRAWRGQRLAERPRLCLGMRARDWRGQTLAERPRLGLGVRMLAWAGGTPGECEGWLLRRLGGWLLRGLCRLSMTLLSCLRLLRGRVGCSWLSRPRSSGGFTAS